MATVCKFAGTLVPFDAHLIIARQAALHDACHNSGLQGRQPWVVCCRLDVAPSRHLAAAGNQRHS
jgi:hypothetical protein